MDVSIEDKVGHKSPKYELDRMCFVQRFLMFFARKNTINRCFLVGKQQ